MNIEFDEEAVRLITLFESLTGVSVKDCIVDEDKVYILIEEGKLGLAIGKNGKKIKSIENLVGKKVKLFEFSPDIHVFIKRIIPQLNKVNLTGDKLKVWVSKKYKPVVIGRDKKNLNILKKILERNFNIKEFIVR